MRGGHWSLVEASEDRKTGGMPVTYAPKQTCPACPISEECYASSGKVRIHWQALSLEERGTDYLDHLEAISDLEGPGPARLHVSGDFQTGPDGRIDREALRALDHACLESGADWFTYTHHDLTDRRNLAAVSSLAGIVANASANDLGHLDDLLDRGLPAVAVVHSRHGGDATVMTPKGRTAVVCPASRTGSEVTCSSCGDGAPLCGRANRPWPIVFPAHGSSKATLDASRA